MAAEIPTFSTEFLALISIRLVSASVIFFIGKWIAKLLTGVAKKGMTKANVEDTLQHFLGNMLYYTLMVAVIIATINKLGVQTTSLLAVVGAAGLAVGLALQGSLSNFASGIMIITFRPYRVGDFIDAGGVTGTVEELQIFTTIMKTPDNKRIIIPNSQIMSGEITNFSANPTRRVDLVAGCGYSDDIDKVRKVLQDIVASDDRILNDPAPAVALSELGDSSINFVVRPWVKSADYWAVHCDTLEQIKKRFDAEGFSIPFPQRDIHLYKHDVV
ncbi:MAG: mechanosensitive ion channel [Gammaproteobacteria bacterium]|jgi:small conductance mechanosensitive channel|nr:mechanosensitive ion channel protein [Chromatiales bacterium]MDP7154463.1 mechanosensitive ion channel [Gammaproteobacteria bacterium]MDP7297065.1 mechanosensitive ion channel [Gammaproteobacteria bacterium]MDP7418822.1 mechanosensitive ion channel [Gammaproteobacteria bacterium]MDP7660990.1 mechanosensitive ion channel [Gammaproteobacteria bacterium]